MSVHITLKLFATLRKFLPPEADRFPIARGTCVRDLIAGLNIPEEKAKLIFINGVKSDLDRRLKGGEQVGIFPPVGGG